MFEDATFHSRGILPSQTPKWMLVTLAFNLTILSALIVFPLVYPEGLPVRLLRSPISIPTPALPTQPHPHTAQSPAPAVPTYQNPYAAPPTIPIKIFTGHDPTPPPAGTSIADPFDSVPGGTGADTSLFHHDPPPVVHPAPSRPFAISQGVAGGLLIYKTNPVYPQIAIAAHVSGTVVLAAVISKTGAIENLRVVAGPPMLRQAAIDAVQQWRYRPYLLNNQPVEVETSVNVVFSLGNR